MSYAINQQITQFYNADGPNAGIKFYGKRPTVSGFPAQPIITYTGGFEKNGIMIAFKTMTLEGFPISGFPLTAKIEKSLGIKNIQTNHTIIFDHAKMTIIAPAALPKSTAAIHLEEWQKEIGQIKIKNMHLQRKKIDINGKGFIGLDPNLQITWLLNTDVRGHEDLVKFFLSSGTLKPLSAALALSALNALADEDPETGEKSVLFDIKIEDRNFSIGPIKMGKTPFIHWR